MKEVSEVNEQKSLLLEIAEAIDRRLRQHTPRDEGPPPEARRPRWLRWLGRQMVPNVGTLLMVVVLLLTVPSLAAPLRAPAATSTSTISYQGRLADSGGNPLTAKVNMEFRIYNVPTGGVPLWAEMWTGGNAVDVSDGLFNVMLGSIDNTLASAIDGHDELYLGITVGTDSEMEPRVQLGSVPFSMQAMTVPDDSITSAEISAGAVSTSELANGAVTGAKIQDGQVGADDVSFNYAGSSSKGGPASNLDCSNCISSSEIQNGQVRNADLENGAVTIAKIDIDDHLDMQHKDIRNIANLVFPYADTRAIQYRGTAALAIQTLNDSSQDTVRMELGKGDYPDVDIKNARLDMNGNPIINQGAMIEANLQTAGELAAERIDRFEQGDVLCWLGERLEKCNEDSDRRVVAVANEKGLPIVIGAEPIRVLGPVQVGDLLVASNVAGYAMVNNAPAPGTVIAKALEAFDGKQGVIKAMINTSS
jgi:hypothetical protein